MIDPNDDDKEIGALEAMQPKTVTEDDIASALNLPTSKADKLGYEELLNTYRQMRTAQDEASKKTQDLTFLAAGNQIAKGIAQGSGAQVGQGEDTIRLLKEQAQAPVKALQQKIDTAKDTMQTVKLAQANEQDAKMADPGSDVSKLYREQAYAMLDKLRKTNPEMPDYRGQLDTMSAQDLLKAPMLKSLLAGPKTPNERGIGFGQFVNSRGEPLVQTNDNRLFNVVTQSYHNPTEGVVRPIGYVNPVTGMREYMGVGVTSQLGGGPAQMPTALPGQPAPKPTVGDYINSQLITPIEREKILNKDKEGFETKNKDKLVISNSLASVGSLADEAIRNPNAAASLGGIIGAFFESGKLTDQDAERYVKREGLSNKAKDWLSVVATGTITKEMASDIKKTAAAYQKEMDNVLRNDAIRMAKATTNGLQRGKEIDPSVIADFYYTPKSAPSEPMVKVKGPSGQTQMIKKSAWETKYSKRPGYTLAP